MLFSSALIENAVCRRRPLARRAAMAFSFFAIAVVSIGAVGAAIDRTYVATLLETGSVPETYAAAGRRMSELWSSTYWCDAGVLVLGFGSAWGTVAFARLRGAFVRVPGPAARARSLAALGESIVFLLVTALALALPFVVVRHAPGLIALRLLTIVAVAGVLTVPLLMLSLVTDVLVFVAADFVHTLRRGSR